MGLNLDKLNFDPTALAESATTGSYLLDAAGTLLTSTLVGGKQSLDINVTQSSGQFAEDSAHSSGHVGNFILAVRNDAGTSLVNADGDYAPIQVNAAGQLLTNAAVQSDKVEDSASANGDTGSYMLSVRQDTPASSTSTDGDYQSIKTDALGRMWVNNAPQSAAYSAVSVTTTATDLVPTDLANRKRIIIQNLSTARAVFVGSNSSVTTANGIKIPTEGSAEIEGGPGINWYGIVSAGTADVRILETA